MTQEELDIEYDLDRLRLKRDQAWYLAGLARKDGDRADELRRTEEARRIELRIRELL